MAAAQLDVSQTTMPPLSARTVEHLTALFELSERLEAERLLLTLANSESRAASTPESLERLRFAALRVSGGSVAGLRAALELARVDWRDLLMSAGFGEDVSAHATWSPRAFNEQVRTAWRRGDALPSVAFTREARVRVTEGDLKEQDAIVLDLLALEPRPRYQVQSDRGRIADAWQSALRPAG